MIIRTGYLIQMQLSNLNAALLISPNFQKNPPCFHAGEKCCIHLWWDRLSLQLLGSIFLQACQHLLIMWPRTSDESKACSALWGKGNQCSLGLPILAITPFYPKLGCPFFLPLIPAFTSCLKRKTFVHNKNSSVPSQFQDFHGWRIFYYEFVWMRTY